MSRWVDLSIEEMKEFFADILHMGWIRILPLSAIVKWMYYYDFIHKFFMSYNRFTNITITMLLAFRKRAT